ncbi:MAG TPA: hypothetical protein VFE05_08920, partial [Longimicrobiaceae bacterium]|nr:hypothetical protein [Longimicrobiaceae bacterium]
MARRRASRAAVRGREPEGKGPEAAKTAARAPRREPSTGPGADRALARKVGEEKAQRMGAEPEGGPPGVHRVPQERGAGSHAVQRQHLPGNGKTQGLDPTSNPALGAAERAKLLIKQGLSGGKQSPPSGENQVFASFVALLKKLDKFEASLRGGAPGKLALNMYGTSGKGSKQSTAARPAKDVVWGSDRSLDLEEIFALMNGVILSVSKPGEIFSTPGDLKEQPAEFVLDWQQKIVELKEALEKIEKEKKGKEQARRDDSTRVSELLHKVQELTKRVSFDFQKLKDDQPKSAAKDKTTPEAKLQKPTTVGATVTGTPPRSFVTSTFQVPKSPLDSEPEALPFFQFYIKAGGG